VNHRRIAALLAILLVVFVPLQSRAQTAQGSLVIMYAYNPEGTLLRSKMRNVTASEDVMGTVVQGELEGVPIVLLPSGVGLINAASSTQRVIDRFQPKWIIFSGIAGGVEPDNHVGDIVVAEKWATHDFGNIGKEGFTPRVTRVPTQRQADVPFSRVFISYFAADPTLLKVAKAASTVVKNELKPVLGRTPVISVEGVGVSGNTFIDNADFRQSLLKTFTARTVDMETSAFMQVCVTNRARCVAVRSSSDLAGGSGSGTAEREIAAFFQVAADNSAAMVIGMVKYLKLWSLVESAR